MVGEQGNYGEWQNVMAQIVTYMAFNHSRYGFIITDTVFVALRITRCEVGPGLAAGRARRAMATTHQRRPSDESMASAGSSYLDDEPLEWEYQDPEYALAPWDAHGRGRLTIRLALWCLAMMAANGDNHIDYWYPDLDSWRLAKEGYYVHNTTGAKKRRLDRGALLSKTPNPETPGGNGPWGAGQPLVAALEGEIGNSSLGYLDLPGTSTGQDMPYFSQAASPFPGGEEEAGREEDEEHSEYGEENSEEKEGAEEEEDEHRGKRKQWAVAQGVPRGGGIETTATMTIGPWLDL
ncbi:uncharacterized protein B0T15DRAFT_537917 [Chaetomium strumarium]|uniref:Uncharacterized protein n=1 Tax=Chaetomium strumarium TaxID=1170767 RepID=A0AAJ0GRP6_9PEZI|nr:hypothetical protein B0T15DRAFT_537917 [Chaetomium strumarium]